MTELQHQANVIKWSQQTSIRSKYPELKMLHHIKNETVEGARRIAIDHAIGVKKGVPDLSLPIPRGEYHGLYVEMKTEKGKTSSEQDWWLEELRNYGYYTAVCRGWKEAVSIIEGYLDGKE